MVDMTLNDLYANVKVILFGTNRFLIYDFLYRLSSDFCSKTTTIHNVTDRQTTDGRNTVS